MADVRGKYITLACSLLETKPEAKEAALSIVKEATGKDFMDLDPEGWYDTKIFDGVFQAIRNNSSPLLANASIKLIGQGVYPTFEKTQGLPKTLRTPLDFVRFEAEGFLISHRGSDVKPRKILSATEGNLVMEATSPGYDCTLIEGVYLGILDMCNVDHKSVRQTKCVKKGDDVCEYLITWMD
jgi:hypothetical protein